MEFYQTIAQEGEALFKDRGSKFLAFAFPIASADDFRTRLAQLKKAHPKAVHFCFAYRIGTDGNNFRVSDDGEPSGTAGKPILGQLDSKGLCNTCIIVVRYFGGTLLGVPGLINAYKTAASLVLQVVPMVKKPIMQSFELHFDYTQMNDVMMLVKQLNCEIDAQEQSLFILLKVKVPKSRAEEFLFRMKDLRNVEVLDLL